MMATKKAGEPSRPESSIASSSDPVDSSSPHLLISSSPDFPDASSPFPLPGLPFDAFDELQAAVAAKSFKVGVDTLAAAEWIDSSGGPLVKTSVAALSILLLTAALAAVVSALVLENYWLLLAVPVQGAVFYLSNPGSAFRTWATVGGALSLPLFLNLVLNGSETAAALVAYAGVTFAAVRAAAFISASGFRKALLGDEQLFLEAYHRGKCSLRNVRTRQDFRA